MEIRVSWSPLLSPAICIFSQPGSLFPCSVTVGLMAEALNPFLAFATVHNFRSSLNEDLLSISLKATKKVPGTLVRLGKMYLTPLSRQQLDFA